MKLRQQSAFSRQHSARRGSASASWKERRRTGFMQGKAKPTTESLRHGEEPRPKARFGSASSVRSAVGFACCKFATAKSLLESVSQMVINDL